ncbi:hypothetical protein FACS1894163_06700 [Spirochaetia bacterium]|nr:hypothetical protein FACS1894163_06700 [Spirochaetia bacterium]
MKKILFVLLILGFVAGGVFAADLGEGLTISGEIASGISAVSTKDGKDDDVTYVSLWHDDGGNARALLNFFWETEVGGFKAQLKGVAGADGGGPVTIPWAWGWVNLFNNKATIVAGKMDNSAWGLGNLSTNAFDPNVDNIAGARLEIKPIDGLNLGVALPLLDGGTYPDSPYPYTGKDISKNFSISFGALYKAPVFEIAVGAKINPEKAATEVKYGYYDDDEDDPNNELVWGINPNDFATPKQDGYVDLIAGVGVPLTDLGLNIAVDFRYVSGKTGYIKVGPKVAFTKDALSVNGKVIFEANNEKASKIYEATNNPKTAGQLLGDGGWIVDIGPTDGDKKASALAFELGAEYVVTPIITGKLYLGSNNLTFLAGNGLWVKPQATLTLSPNTEINVFDKIGNIGTDKDKGIGAKIYNQFQINFTWKF